MDEIRVSFATNAARQRLFSGFEKVVAALQHANCQTIYLDGSFVTGKPTPDDFDGCWEPAGVQVSKLDPVLLKFKPPRTEQKSKYFGEMFVSSAPAAPGKIFLDFFSKKNIPVFPKGSSD
jgi:Family of unknown function (DUF6932)